MPQISILAVLVASVSGFMIGGLWYSPVLLGKRWQREAELTDEKLRQGSPAVIFGGAFVLSLLASFTFAAFLGPDVTLAQGAIYGFLAGLFWVSGTIGVIYLFERRSVGLFLINAGYSTLWFTTIGSIIALLS